MFGYLYVILGNDFFGISQNYLFYSIFWNIGLLSADIRIDKLHKLFIYLIVIITGILFSSYIFNMKIHDLQAAKFPPHILYFFASSLSVILSIYFKQKSITWNSKIVHIGKNAIFYFFAQGISSSLLYRITDKIHINIWGIKWVVMFCINLIIAIVVAEGLRLLYGKVKQYIDKFWTITKNIMT